jgi:aldehyde:ferredoxin oxidoreductase
LKGWWGRILWVDLSSGDVRVWEYPREWALDYIGGRGFAARILWEFMPPGADPLGLSLVQLLTLVRLLLPLRAR